MSPTKSPRQKEGPITQGWGAGEAKYCALSESLGMQIGPCAGRTANGLWLGGAAAHIGLHWTEIGRLTFRDSWTVAKRDCS